MVCRKKKKATVSAIRQPTSFNLDNGTSSRLCFFATTTFAFGKGGAELFPRPTISPF
jgi:hypothetical protein